MLLGSKNTDLFVELVTKGKAALPMFRWERSSLTLKMLIISHTAVACVARPVRCEESRCSPHVLNPVIISDTSSFCLQLYQQE